MASKSAGALAPLIKWTGGKRAELPIIHRHLPDRYDRFLEPFVGGGAVYFSMHGAPRLINDLSTNLIDFYRSLQAQDAAFHSSIAAVAHFWRAVASALPDHLPAGRSIYNLKHAPDLAQAARAALDAGLKDLPAGEIFTSAASAATQARLEKDVHAKIKPMHRIAAKNGIMVSEARDTAVIVETVIKSAAYTTLREMFNHNSRQLSSGARAALFFFLRETCFSSMFRYNARGEFNVPYGGSSFNAKRLDAKPQLSLTPAYQAHLSGTHIFNQDFEVFLREQATRPGDFIFVDQPYDSTFSAYDGNSFGEDEQRRLARVLDRIPGRWLMAVGDTPLIRSLYDGRGLWISPYGKEYKVSFRDRNDRSARHLLIANYIPPAAG